MNREAFEAWLKSEGVEPTLWMPHAPEAGYENNRLNDYWTGWKAATAHARDVAVRVCESVSHDNPMTANDCADAIKEALK